MFKTISRRAFSTRGHPNAFQIPFYEESLMTKMRDQHFSQYGLKLLKNKTNLFKSLSVINTSYIIKNDTVGDHRTAAFELQDAQKYFNKEFNFELLNTDQLLESMFSTIYLSLHYYKDNHYLEYNTIISLIKLMVNSCYYSIFKTPIPHNINLHRETNTLVNTYYLDVKDSDHIIISSTQQKVLECSLYSFMEFVKKHDLPYTPMNVRDWLVSINSPSIGQSSTILKDSQTIPSFIIRDLLLRQPRSAHELQILLDMCLNNLESAFTIESVEVPLVLKNLVQGCISFGTDKLQPLVSSILAQDVLSKLDKSDTIIFCNKLMFLISQTNVLSPRNKLFYKDLLNAQTSILSWLSVKNPDMRTNDLLTIDGSLGIATIFQLMGDNKSFEMFSHIESEHDRIMAHLFEKEGFTKVSQLSELTKRYCTSANILELHANVSALRILLAPSELKATEEFDRLVQMSSNNNILVRYSKLWRSYVLSLKRLKKLNSATAHKTWRLYSRIVLQAAENTRSVNIDAMFIAELISPMNDINRVISVFNELQAKKYKLNRLIMTKFLSKLYWAIAKASQTGGKAYTDLLSYTRSLYGNLSDKSTSLRTTMLLGEARLQPEKLYSLFYRELKDSRKDQNALRALCLAAVSHHSRSDRELLWFYEEKEWKPCYEVCILEFRKALAKTADDFGGVLPDNNLWREYIEFLALFKLKSELLELFSLWDDMNFMPTEEMILKVLVNIDKNDAMRVLRHGKLYSTGERPQTVRSEAELKELRDHRPSDRYWPWPDEQVFVNYRYEDDRRKGDAIQKRGELVAG